MSSPRQEDFLSPGQAHQIGLSPLLPLQAHGGGYFNYEPPRLYAFHGSPFYTPVVSPNANVSSPTHQPPGPGLPTPPDDNTGKSSFASGQSQGIPVSLIAVVEPQPSQSGGGEASKQTFLNVPHHAGVGLGLSRVSTPSTGRPSLLRRESSPFSFTEKNEYKEYTEQDFDTVEKDLIPPGAPEDSLFGIEDIEADSKSKPTCTLDLAVYRQSKGNTFTGKRIQVLRHNVDPEPYRKKNPHIVTTDEEFFRGLQRIYREEMCTLARRYFSLKTVRRIELLSYTNPTRPKRVPLDEFAVMEIFHAYKNPSSVGDSHEWIDWVFRLRTKDKRHALEFVESWSGKRIAAAGSIPWVLSTIFGILWSVFLGDLQTAFTVAGFILTACNSLLALIAVLSSIKS